MSTPVAIHVALQPSPRIAWFFAAVHALTLLPLWRASLPQTAMIIVSIIVIAHAAWVIYAYALLRSRRSIVGIAISAAGQCTLVRRDGTEIDGTLHPSTVVSGQMVIVALRPASSSKHRVRPLRHAVVVGEMIVADDFRILRVMLKWSSRGSLPGSPADGAATRALMSDAATALHR